MCVCLRLSPSPSPSSADGMFGFLETYEKQSVDLKVSEFEASEEKKELETKLQEVGHNSAQQGQDGGPQ